MDYIKIKGGKSLKGEVSVSGAKNSALPIIFSSLLAEGLHTFKNVPQLQDIKSAKVLLEYLNCDVSFEKNIFKVKVKPLKNFQAPYSLVKKMRASILCLGPLLAKYGQAEVSLPGGCAIGSRPINFHIDALKQLGAQAKVAKGYVYMKAKKLRGSRIIFENITVGGTENILMAACLTQGKTIIENAAKEPEIVDLAQYLISMGAKISGHGTSVIRVEGVKKLFPNEHKIIPDRIEAGTLLLAGAITKGDVKVKNCFPEHLQALIDKMKESRFNVETGKNWIATKPCSQWKGVDVTTSAYPGFATDLQAQFMALMSQAQGTSVITESVFENRFMHVQELVRLGADILPKSQVAIVRGKRKLQGTQVMATDLRASACLILGGLAAQGETQLHRVYHLDRGYEHLEKKLAHLGAQIERISQNHPFKH